MGKYDELEGQGCSMKVGRGLSGASLKNKIRNGWSNFSKICISVGHRLRTKFWGDI